MKHFYEFGDFRVDRAEQLLLRGGQPVSLPPKVFDTLVLLVENSGHLIEKEEFLKRLWPDTFVEEAALTQNISLLRKVLGDAEGQRFIETVSKRGYRFVPKVRKVALPVPGPAEEAAPLAAAASAGTPVERVALENRARAWRRPGLALLAVSVLLALGVGYFYLRQPGQAFSRAATTPIRSLAVLPLHNLSRDPEQEYFADGMTDELITDLAKIGALRVISRTSVMRYKGTQKSLPEIARELNVDALVEGTVSRSPGRVHITVQLIRARPEHHLWAESYDRPLGDAVTLQAELAREIGDVIRAKLTPQEQASLARTRPVNPEAYQAYLRGRYFWNKRTGKGFQKAIEYFQQAIEKDPTYARSYAGLADAYLLLGGYGVVPQAETISKAKAAARKALEIDETLAEAHTSLGLIAGNSDWDWAEAEREYKRAIQLNPNYATAHHWYGEGYLALMGRFDEAIAEMEKAQALDPLSTIISTDAGVVFYLGRQYDRAIEQLRKTLEMDPNFTMARVWLASAYGQKGMFREAIAELQKSWRSDDTLYSWAELGRLYAVSGRRDEARRMLDELKRLAPKRHVDPLCLAHIYIGLGEKDRAFEWLEREYEARSTGLTSLKVHPGYDLLRSDPRFQDLMRRVGLPP